jgi:hypothetical protein
MYREQLGAIIITIVITQIIIHVAISWWKSKGKKTRKNVLLNLITGIVLTYWLCLTGSMETLTAGYWVQWIICGMYLGLFVIANKDLEVE